MSSETEFVPGSLWRHRSYKQRLHKEHVTLVAKGEMRSGKSDWFPAATWKEKDGKVYTRDLSNFLQNFELVPNE